MLEGYGKDAVSKEYEKEYRFEVHVLGAKTVNDSVHGIETRS